jgi:hypothetical protein
VARYVRDAADLPAAVAACRDDPDLRGRAERLAEGFGSAPSAGEVLIGLCQGVRKAAAAGLPDPLARKGEETAGPVSGRAPRHRGRRLSVSLVAVIAVFLVVTSGASVSFAASHLGLPAVARARQSALPSVVLCIRASDPAVLAGLPRILESRNAQATFFLPSNLVQSDPALLSSLATVGEIQNGGTDQRVSRFSNPFRLRREVILGTEMVYGATGHTPVFYLPSQGSLNPAAFFAARSLHERGVVGSVWIRSRRQTSKDLDPGDVVVMDLSQRTPAQARAMLSAVLGRAAGRGLHVVDLSSVKLGRGPNL